MKRLTIYRNGDLEINCKNCPEEKRCKREEFTESDCLYFLTKRLAEYEDAEEQGLLVRLPCKVGDTLYHASHAFKRVDEYTVLSISMLLSPNVSRMEINAVNHRGAVLPFDVSDFSDTVFLTREAAEKALEDA